MSKKKNIILSIPVPKSLDDVIEMIVETGMHSSKSELVRDSLRREIQRLGYSPKMEVPRKTC